MSLLPVGINNRIVQWRAKEKQVDVFVNDASGSISIDALDAYFYAKKYPIRSTAALDISIGHYSKDVTKGKYTFDLFTFVTDISTGDYVYEVVLQDKSSNRFTVVQDRFTILNSLNLDYNEYYPQYDYYYPFNTDISTSPSSVANLILIPKQTSTYSFVPGINNNCVLFNNTGSLKCGFYNTAAYYYPLGDGAKFGMHKDFSISLWVKNRNTVGEAFIWSTAPTWIHPNWGGPLLSLNNNVFYYDVRTFTDVYNEVVLNSINSGTIVSTDWNHIVLTQDSSLSFPPVLYTITRKLYVNGTLKSTGVFTATTNDYVNQFCFFGQKNTNQVGANYKGFDGYLDETRVFFRELSPFEIKYLYDKK